MSVTVITACREMPPFAVPAGVRVSGSRAIRSSIALRPGNRLLLPCAFPMARVPGFLPP